MNLDPALMKSLTLSANYFVKKMNDKIDAVRAPKVIKNAVSIGSPQASGGNASITITIDLGTAPMAAAYEWGSGIHNTKGEAKTYVIPRTLGKKLKIPAERWPNKLYNDDPAFLPFVNHPGVAPRPYIEPTITAELPEIKKIIGREVKAQVLIGLKEMFKA